MKKERKLTKININSLAIIYPLAQEIEPFSVYN